MGHKIKNFAFLVFSFAAIAAAQKQNMGPTAAPQINSTYYVGAVPGWYATIQLAVTAACTSAGARVQIPAGSSPADTPTAATGCTNVAIVDQRTLPDTCYSWSGSAYVAAACASGAANPGGDFQNAQFNDGVGGFGGSLALLNPSGDFIAKSYGGTRDALLNQSGVNTGDGIVRSLQTPGNVVTVNGGYDFPEGKISNAGWRSPFCCGGTAAISPGFAADTIQVDYRGDNTGTFYYDLPGEFSGNVYDLNVSDQTPQTAGTGYQWVWHQIDRVKIGSGKNQQDLHDSGNWDVYGVEVRNLIDLTRGISNNTAIEVFKGEGDFQGHQCQIIAHGDDPDGSGEGKTCDRRQMLQDGQVWLGAAIQTYAKGATVVSNGHGPSPPYMYDADYLVDSTQAGSPFYIAPGASPDSGTVTPATMIASATFTPDNWGKQTADMADGAAPQLYNGAGTPVVVSVSGLASAFTPDMKVCVGDMFNDESIQIPSSGTTFVGGTMTFTASFRFWHPAGTTYSQGPQSCHYLEVLANQVGAFRNLYLILGASDAHTLMYSAHIFGGWSTAPLGSYSQQNFPAGTVFVRDASGIVTITIPGIESGGQWLNQQIVINANSGLPTDFFGNWGQLTEIIDSGLNEVITFNTGVSGAATSATSTGPVYVSKGGMEANTARLMPGAEIVYAGNPSTHINDGTVQIALNDMTINAGDQLESQAGPNVVMDITHDQIQMLSATSPASPSIAYYAGVTGRPNDGFTWHTYFDQVEQNYFIGDGGTHAGMQFATITGPHYQGFWSINQPMRGGDVFRITGCGEVPDDARCGQLKDFGWDFLSINTNIGSFTQSYQNWNTQWEEDLNGSSGFNQFDRWGGATKQGGGGVASAGWSLFNQDNQNGTQGQLGTDYFSGSYMSFSGPGGFGSSLNETAGEVKLTASSSSVIATIDLTDAALSFPDVPTTFPQEDTVTFSGQLPCLENGDQCPTTTGVTNITINIAATGAVAPGCSTSTGSASMPNLLTSSTPYQSPATDFSTVTGWGTQDLYLFIWPTANQLNYHVCNRTALSITPSAAVSFNVGAQK